MKEAVLFLEINDVIHAKVFIFFTTRILQPSRATGHPSNRNKSKKIHIDSYRSTLGWTLDALQAITRRHSEDVCCHPYHLCLPRTEQSNSPTFPPPIPHQEAPFRLSQKMRKKNQNRRRLLTFQAIVFFFRYKFRCRANVQHLDEHLGNWKEKKVVREESNKGTQ